MTAEVDSSATFMVENVTQCDREMHLDLVFMGGQLRVQCTVTHRRGAFYLTGRPELSPELESQIIEAVHKTLGFAQSTKLAKERHSKTAVQ